MRSHQINQRKNKITMFDFKSLSGVSLIIFLLFCSSTIRSQDLSLKTDQEERFSAPGISVLAWHNNYPAGRRGGVEILMHGDRIATNGDLRLSPVPIPDSHLLLMPEFKERKVFPDKNEIHLEMEYPDLDFTYRLRMRSEGMKIHIFLDVNEKIPDEVVGKLSFMLELFPMIYRNKSFFMDDIAGTFPHQFNGLNSDSDGSELEVLPMESGRSLSLAPEDPLHHMKIISNSGKIDIMDGRASSNHKWFIVRELVPENGGKGCVEWTIEFRQDPEWRAKPIIGFAQIGYHTKQPKISIIEMDKRDKPTEVKLYRIDKEGNKKMIKSGLAENPVDYYSKKYAEFDFSEVDIPGLYQLEYRDQITESFMISENLYEKEFWRPSLETFIPVQMCHMEVRDRLRLWHGWCHKDDALQAPAAMEHFDVYDVMKNPPEIYEAYEHIPNMAEGGWHDAGDSDIEGSSNLMAVYNLAQACESFEWTSDQTSVDYSRHKVELHVPDGKVDIYQQIIHGVKWILGNYRSFGNLSQGVVGQNFQVYLQMGGIDSQTDGLLFDPVLDTDVRTTTHSGKNDDRIVFNEKSVPREFMAAKTLAISARVLDEINPEIAEECLSTAIGIWERESKSKYKPKENSYFSRHFESLKKEAAIELYLSTKDDKYLEYIISRPENVSSQNKAGQKRYFADPEFLASMTRIIDEVKDEKYLDSYLKALHYYKNNLDRELSESPYGVPRIHTMFGTGFWYMMVAKYNYLLYEKYPEIFTPEPIYAIVTYMHGNHPVSNHSLVNGVGGKSITSAYGFNRADRSYIPGGICAGPLLILPDLVEFQIDDPFFWVQKEYTIASGTSYVFLMKAMEELAKEGGE